MLHTELQEVVLEQGERGLHTSGGTVFTSLVSDIRVCLELACKTHRLEVFHLVAPTHYAIHGSSSLSVMCVGFYFQFVEAHCVHVSFCWTDLRVVCSSAHHVALESCW